MLWTRRWRDDGSLVYGTAEIPTRCVDDRYWVGFADVEVLNTTPPPGITHLLPVSPERCAIAGPEDGYLIAELPAGSNLVTVQPPGTALGQVTGRALIVTCAPDDALGVDIEFRYFAPQYGPGEDVATGSAMRVLAQYWKQRGLGGRISALQRSPEGGLLHSRIEGARTWVGGRVIDE